LQKALELDPKSGEAHNNLGNTLLRMGRIAKAVAELKKALEIGPNNVNAQNNLAWILATSPEASTRNGAKAVELAERADHLTRAGTRSSALRWRPLMLRVPASHRRCKPPGMVWT
jgi:Flp pilus assembly protein TadD